MQANPLSRAKRTIPFGMVFLTFKGIRTPQAENASESLIVFQSSRGSLHAPLQIPEYAS